MRRDIHGHPLQSFRFWFLLLAAVSMVAAWKLDLFGNRRARNAEVASEDVPAPNDEIAADEEMIADEFGDQLEPAPEPGDGNSAVGGFISADSAGQVAPYRSSERPDAAQHRPAVSPFGPANPEFVAAPREEAPAEDEGLVRTAMAEEPVNPLAATSRREMQKTKPLVVPASNAETADRGASRVAPAHDEQTAPAAPGANAGEIDLAEIDRLIEANDDVAALRMMSDRYWKSPQSRPQFQDRLDALGQRVYLQSNQHYMDPYVVQNGDMLQAIAKTQNVSWQYLAKLNRTDPKKIRPGQKLKVIKGPFGAVVDLSDFELTIHAHGHFVKRYPIGVGKDETTPIGKFKVEEKLTDPTYYGPEMVIEHDDPANPLGEYWVGIGNSFGIHGTIEPESIGKAESQGCVRMRDADIAEVYDFLTTGSEVVIRR